MPMILTLSETELPVRLRFERQMTDDELLEFCCINDPLQFERDSNGELIVMSPSFADGGSVEVDVMTELNIWARADGRGKVFGSSAGFTLHDTSMRAPDASWIRWERWNALTAEQKHSYSPICPNFVIEVRSSTDRLKRLQQKMEMWIANGAELAWIIDPIAKSVAIYRPGQETEFYENPSSVLGDGPVSGFELVMDRVWSGQ